MTVSRRRALACAVGILALLPAGSALAAGRVVHVSLWDKGPNSMEKLGTGPMMVMGMKGGDMAMATMGIKVDHARFPAGEVTFEVVNASKDIVHEMIVAPVADAQTPLRYDDSSQMLDEDAAGSLGEVSELDPGKSGTLHLTLKPGQYLLYCNVPGHYVLGMWTLITATK